MNSNEVKIRGELERDVERDLEDEIKEGICQLALRLHKLYKQQEERNTKKLSIDDHGTSTNTKALSEVNINIKMEGDTKIEIKVIKKEARRPSSNKASSNVQRMLTTRPPKFDWTQSLRSGPTPVTGYDKIDTSRKQVKNIINKNDQQNVKVLESALKKFNRGLK